MKHKDIINLWPTLKDFADDIGVAYGTAKAMRRRNSIPAIYWDAIISKASNRNIAGITYKLLVATVSRPSNNERAA